MDAALEHPRAMMRALVLAAALALAAIPAEAQLASGVTLRPGAEVRVTLFDPAKRYYGSILSAEGDTLRFRDEDDGPMAQPFTNVRSIAVQQGKNRKRGVLIGAAILGGIGVVFGGIDVARDRMPMGEYLGTIAGNAAFGGLLGYFMAPDSWVELPILRK